MPGRLKPRRRRQTDVEAFGHGGMQDSGYGIQVVKPRPVVAGRRARYGAGAMTVLYALPSGRQRHPHSILHLDPASASGIPHPASRILSPFNPHWPFSPNPAKIAGFAVDFDHGLCGWIVELDLPGPLGYRVQEELGRLPAYRRLIADLHIILEPSWRNDRSYPAWRRRESRASRYGRRPPWAAGPSWRIPQNRRSGPPGRP